MFRRGEPNDSGVFYARKGMYRGRVMTFTHRSKKTGLFWGESARAGDKFYYGTWCDPRAIVWGWFD